MRLGIDETNRPKNNTKMKTAIVMIRILFHVQNLIRPKTAYIFSNPQSREARPIGVLYLVTSAQASSDN
jgi:hypothetical protein